MRNLFAPPSRVLHDSLLADLALLPPPQDENRFFPLPYFSVLSSRHTGNPARRESMSSADLGRIKRSRVTSLFFSLFTKIFDRSTLVPTCFFVFGVSRMSPYHARESSVSFYFYLWQATPVPFYPIIIPSVFFVDESIPGVCIHKALPSASTFRHDRRSFFSPPVAFERPRL